MPIQYRPGLAASPTGYTPLARPERQPWYEYLQHAGFRFAQWFQRAPHAAPLPPAAALGLVASSG